MTGEKKKEPKVGFILFCNRSELLNIDKIVILIGIKLFYYLIYVFALFLERPFGFALIINFFASANFFSCAVFLLLSFLSKGIHT